MCNYFVVKNRIFKYYKSAYKFALKIHYPIIFSRNSLKECNKLIQKNINEDRDIIKLMNN